MAQELHGMRVAFVVANEGVEQVELTRPWEAVEQAGGRPELVAPETGYAQAMHHLEQADAFPVDRTTEEVDTHEYGAVVLPGGVANPDRLRLDHAAVTFIQAMFDAGKPAAVICHGAWTLVEADVIRGRTLTSWPSLQTDIRNAGGTWVNEQVVTCTDGPNTLVTSRKPDDLDAFCATLIDVCSDAAARTSAA